MTENTPKTKEWVEKKAKRILAIAEGGSKVSMESAKIFIRTLLNEAPKPKVSKNLIQKIQSLLLDVAEKETGVVLAIARIIGWLIEEGFKVEE